MAYFQNPDPVKITPLDLGEIKKENALSSLYNQRLADMAYESNSRNALNDAIKRDPTGENVLRDVAQKGFGKEGLSYSYNWLNRQHAALKYEMDMRREVSNIVGSISDEGSKNQALDYIQSKFPDADLGQYRAMPWENAKKAGNSFLLGASGRVEEDRRNATGAAVGAPAGVDPSLWNSINMTRNADQRAAAAEGRSAGLYPGQLEQQGATFEHTQASTESLRNKQQIVYGPDPTDWRGKKKVPGIVMPGENGGPGTFTPLQGVQGQQPGGSGDETQGGPLPQVGQAAGQATQGSPVPGARQAPDGNWYVPDSTRPGKYLRVN